MDRPIKPYEEVKALLGSASPAWEKLTGHIRFHYMMDEIWAEGKPTHKNRNNLYFKRGGKSLMILGIREGHFIVAIVYGKDEREKFEQHRNEFSEAVQKEYDAAETLHDGKWMGFDVYDDILIDDIIKLLSIKRKPTRKVLPESMDGCGCLDIGLSHEDITNRLIP